MATTPMAWARPSACGPAAPLPVLARRSAAPVLAFRRNDIDGLARRVASGEALRDAWRSANNGIEQLTFEARRAADRLDHQFSLSSRFDSATRAAAVRARELDQELGLGRRWRAFSADFPRNWPRYRKGIIEFLQTPIGKGLTTIFFLWFALSGWLFNFVIFVVVLLFSAPLLNKITIQGTCPACKRQFVGIRSQVITCKGCRGIVWKPAGDSSSSSSRPSVPDVIDVELEEK